MYVGDIEVNSIKKYPQVGQLPHFGVVKLGLQFYVLLMMGAKDTRNMWSDFGVQ